MSLISEALKRVREQAGQGGAHATPPIFPRLPPPAPRARTRTLIAVSLATSLAVSLVVGGALFLALGRTRTAEKPGTAEGALARAEQAAGAPVVRGAAPVPPASQAADGAPPATLPRRAGAAADPARARPAEPSATAPTPVAEPAAPAVPEKRAAPVALSAPPSPKPAAEGLRLADGSAVTLDGIVWGDSPIAMLNGRLMGVGERLGIFTLTRIEARRVILTDERGSTHILDLGR